MQALIILLPMLLAMYFLMIRPQQKRARDQQQLLASLEVGDDILTSSGIYGTISDIDGGTVFILVCDGVEIKVSKESIATKVSYADASAD